MGWIKLQILWLNLHEFFVVQLHYLDKLGSPDEVDSIFIMFLHARSNGEDVGVKDDVIGVKPHFADQQLVSSSADFHFAVCICGLERTEHL